MALNTQDLMQASVQNYQEAKARAHSLLAQFSILSAPRPYLSTVQSWQELRGLVDTCGHASKGVFQMIRAVGGDLPTSHQPCTCPTVYASASRFSPFSFCQQHLDPWFGEDTSNAVPALSTSSSSSPSSSTHTSPDLTASLPSFFSFAFTTFFTDLGDWPDRSDPWVTVLHRFLQEQQPLSVQVCR